MRTHDHHVSKFYLAVWPSAPGCGEFTARYCTLKGSTLGEAFQKTLRAEVLKLKVLCVGSGPVPRIPLANHGMAVEPLASCIGNRKNGYSKS